MEATQLLKIDRNVLPARRRRLPSQLAMIIGQRIVNVPVRATALHSPEQLRRHLRSLGIAAGAAIVGQSGWWPSVVEAAQRGVAR